MLLKNGRTLLVVLALLLSSCRSSVPPAIPICLGDGVGGADCVLEDGSRKYLPPSDLLNYWMTTQEGMKKFSSWCYQTDENTVSQEMKGFELKAHGYQ